MTSIVNVWAIYSARCYRYRTCWYTPSHVRSTVIPHNFHLRPHHQHLPHYHHSSGFLSQPALDSLRILIFAFSHPSYLPAALSAFPVSFEWERFPLLDAHQDDSIADDLVSSQADQRNRLDTTSERLHSPELRRRPRTIFTRMRDAQPVTPGHEGCWQGQCDRARSAISVLWAAGTLGLEVSCGRESHQDLFYLVWMKCCFLCGRKTLPSGNPANKVARLTIGMTLLLINRPRNTPWPTKRLPSSSTSPPSSRVMPRTRIAPKTSV